MPIFHLTEDIDLAIKVVADDIASGDAMRRFLGNAVTEILSWPKVDRVTVDIQVDSHSSIRGEHGRIKIRLGGLGDVSAIILDEHLAAPCDNSIFIDMIRATYEKAMGIVHYPWPDKPPDAGALYGDVTAEYMSRVRIGIRVPKTIRIHPATKQALTREWAGLGGEPRYVIDMFQPDTLSMPNGRGLKIIEGDMIEPGKFEFE